MPNNIKQLPFVTVEDVNTLRRLAIAFEDENAKLRQDLGELRLLLANAKMQLTEAKELIIAMQEDREVLVKDYGAVKTESRAKDILISRLRRAYTLLKQERDDFYLYGCSPH